MIALRFVNGSWLCALVHRLLGADAPLSVQWLSSDVTDHSLLRLEADAVVDRSAVLTGHSSQPDGTLNFRKTGVGRAAVLHPYAMALDGTSLGDESTLDLMSHFHLAAHIPEREFWSDAPARAVRNSRVN